MAGTSVGSVSVAVVPSAQGWSEELKSQLLPEADELGEEIGQRIRDGIEEQLADIHFEPHADTEEAEADVEHLQEKLDDLHGEAHIGAEAEEANAVLDEFDERLDETGAKKTVTTIGADAEQADSAVDILDAKLTSLQDRVTELAVEVSDPDAIAKLERLQASLDLLKDELNDIVIHINDEDADQRLANLSGYMDAFRAQAEALVPTLAADSAAIDETGASAAAAAPEVDALAEAHDRLRAAADSAVAGIVADTGALAAEAAAAEEARASMASFMAEEGTAGEASAGLQGTLVELRSQLGDQGLGDALTVTKTGLNEFEIASGDATLSAEKLGDAAGGADGELKKLASTADGHGGGGGAGAGGGLLQGLLFGALAVAPAFIVAAAAVATFAGAAIPDILDIVHHNAEYQGSLDQIKAEYLALAKAVKPEVVTDFDDALAQAKAILPEFTATAQDGGKAVGSLINQIGNFIQSGDTKSFLSFVGNEAPSNLQAFGNAIQGAGTFIYGLTESLDGISKTLLSVAGGVLSFGGDVLHTIPWLGQWAVAIGAAYISATKIPAVLRAIAESNFSQWLSQSSAGLSALGAAYTAAAAGGAAETAEMTVLAAETAAVTAEAAALEVEVAGLIAELAALDPELVGLDAGLAALDAEMAATAVEGGVLAGVLGVLDAINPLVWVAGAVVAVGALTGVLIESERAGQSWVQSLAAADDATGSNTAGYEKLSTQLKGATNAQVAMQAATDKSTTTFESIHLGITGQTSAVDELTAAQKKAAAEALISAAAQGHISTATLQANAATTTYGDHLATLQNAYHLTTAEAIQLADGAKVSTSALENSGAAGEKAMEKINAYADAGAKASSQTVQFAVDMALATGDALTLTGRVQALTNALSIESSGTESANTAVATFHQGLAQLETDMTASADRAGYLTKAQQTTALALSQEDAAARAASAGILQITGSSAKAVGPLEQMRTVLEDLKDPTEADRELLAELNADIAKLKSKSITIGVHIEESGSGVGVPVPGGISGTTVHNASTGWRIPGYGGGDTVPALLERGETVVSKEHSQQLAGAFREVGVPGYADGGIAASASFGFPQDIFNITVPVWGWGTGGSPISGGSLGDEFRTTSGETAKQIAAEQKAMEDAGKTIVKAFRDGSLTTASQIKSETQQAISVLEKYYAGPAATRLENTIRQQSSEMEKLANASAKVSATIANMKAFSAQEVTSLQGFSAISNITGTTNSATGATAPVTGSQIAAGLQKDLATLRRFEKIITDLKNAKVAKSLIEQVVAMGPAGGIEYGEAILSGGKKLIAELDKYETAIGGEETVIGHTSAEIQYGQSITKGFLSSLDKEKSELDKRMKDLGEQIAKELAKALHIKVPGSGSGSGGGGWPMAVAGGASTGTIARDSLTRADINDIRSSLRTTTDRELNLMTKSQAAEVISLLKAAPKATGSAAGTAVADALNSAASKARAQAKARTR